jgi:hypothetical protein
VELEAAAAARAADEQRQSAMARELGELKQVTFMMTKAVAEIPLRFCSFHLRF